MVAKASLCKGLCLAVATTATATATATGSALQHNSGDRDTDERIFFRCVFDHIWYVLLPERDDTIFVYRAPFLYQVIYTLFR